MKEIKASLGLVVVSAILLGPLAPAGRAANLLSNPGFAEAGATMNEAAGWTLNGGLRTSSVLGGTSHDGDGWVLAFREDLLSVGGWGTASQTLAAAPNQEWTFSGWVFHPSRAAMHDPDYALLEIIFTTGTGTTTFQSLPLDLNSLPQDQWMSFSKTAVAPAGATQVSFQASYYRGDTSASTRIYFDQFSASAVPEPHVAVVAAVVPVLAVLALKLKRRKPPQV